MENISIRPWQSGPHLFKQGKESQDLHLVFGGATIDKFGDRADPIHLIAVKYVPLSIHGFHSASCLRYSARQHHVPTSFTQPCGWDPLFTRFAWLRKDLHPLNGLFKCVERLLPVSGFILSLRIFPRRVLGYRWSSSAAPPGPITLPLLFAKALRMIWITASSNGRNRFFSTTVWPAAGERTQPGPNQQQLLRR